MSLTASRARLLVPSRGPERASALSSQEARRILRELGADASTGLRRQAIATLVELAPHPSFAAHRASSHELCGNFLLASG